MSIRMPRKQPVVEEILMQVRRELAEENQAEPAAKVPRLEEK
jgi:hypothetical protein